MKIPRGQTDAEKEQTKQWYKRTNSDIHDSINRYKSIYIAIVGMKNQTKNIG
jgi:hypothetical protein